MKKYLFLALGVAALTSCSSDELTELNQGNEIKFSVVADNDSRAANVWCNENLMPDFYIYANNGSNAFINEDHIQYEGGVWANKTATNRYWPESGKLDFYAIYGAKNYTTVDEKAKPSLVNFTPDADVAKQVDVLYAYSKDQEQSTNSGTVALNFRHALSQIEFQAKNTNEYIDVQIEQVVVGNVLSTGNFTMPTKATGEDKYGEHNDGTNTNTLIENQGTWTLATTTANYTVETLDKTAYVAYNNTSNLTCATGDNDADKSWGKTMLLLPQTNAQVGGNGGEWNTTTAVTPEGTASTGTYLGVKCKIYNVTKVGETVHRTLIYGTDADYKWALVPVDLTWDQGKKYVYTFVFSTGNGGYTPGGDDVLNGISLDVTVDDFILGGGSEETMKTEE